MLENAPPSDRQTRPSLLTPLEVDVEVQPPAGRRQQGQQKQRQRRRGTRCCCGASCPPCRKAWAVLLLVLHQLLAIVYFSLQATDVLDYMVDEPGVRQWLEISPAVLVVVWLCLPPAAIYGWAVGLRICCCEARILRPRLRMARRRRQQQQQQQQQQCGAKDVCCASLSWLGFHLSPLSPVFLYLLLATEIVEFVLQVLALEQYSVSGVDQLTLVLYIVGLTFNCLGPLAILVLRGRHQQDLKRLGRWVRSLLLFDATFDLLYSLFPIADAFVLRFWPLFMSKPEPTWVVNAYTRLGKVDITTIKSKADKKAFILLSAARAVFFGGSHFSKVFVKLGARVAPLFLLPRRIELAESSEVLLALLATQRAASAAATAAAAAGGLRTVITAAGTVPVPSTGTTGQQRRRQSSTSTRDGNSMVRALRVLKRKTTFGRSDSVYWPIHLAIGLPVLLTMVALCLTLLGMAATWPKCDAAPPFGAVKEGEDDPCILRTFPLFDMDAGARACACNVLAMEANRSVCDHESGYLTSLARNSSLNKKRLQYAQIVGINACDSDTRLLAHMTQTVVQPVVVYVNSISSLKYSWRPYNAPAPTCNWIEPSLESAGNTWWHDSLAGLHLAGMRFGGSLPSFMASMSNLQILGLQNMDLTIIPTPELISSPSLQVLKIQGNSWEGGGIRSLPEGFLHSVRLPLTHVVKGCVHSSILFSCLVTDCYTVSISAPAPLFLPPPRGAVHCPLNPVAAV